MNGALAAGAKGFCHFAYTRPPNDLLAPTARLAPLCRQHATELRLASGVGIPRAPDPTPPASLKELALELAGLGWQRPATVVELQTTAPRP